MNATNRHADSTAPHRDWLDDLANDHPVAGAPTLDRKHYQRESDYDDFQHMADESDESGGMRAAALIAMAALVGAVIIVLGALWWLA